MNHKLMIVAWGRPTRTVLVFTLSYFVFALNFISMCRSFEGTLLPCSPDRKSSTQVFLEIDTEVADVDPAINAVDARVGVGVGNMVRVFALVS